MTGRRVQRGLQVLELCAEVVRSRAVLQRMPWKRSRTLTSSWWPSWNGVAVMRGVPARTCAERTLQGFGVGFGGLVGEEAGELVRVLDVVGLVEDEEGAL